MTAAQGEKTRTLVTGAGGFLGSHICRYLGNSGHAIAAVGRLNTNLASSDLYPNLWKFCGMTLPDERFAGVIKEFQPELLVHCAGTASVAESVSDPYGDFRRTVEVCAYALETIRRFSPECRFVLLSSASVYGNPAVLPVSEAAAVKPVSPYGYHKMLCETLVEEYSLLHGLKTVALRIFSAYGERLCKQVVHDMCRQFCNSSNPSVKLFGTGSESRDFIHAVDIARAIECIHEADASGIFNIASGAQTTIMELACMVKQLFGSSKQLVFNGIARQGDPLNWQASIKRIESLGFVPSITMGQGLAQYVAWFRSYCAKEMK